MIRILAVNLLIFVPLLNFPLDTYAQESQTLISKDIRHGGFGAPVYGVTVVNGQPSYLRGIRGAWVINLSGDHAVNIGLGSYRSGNDFEPARWTNPDISEPDMETKYRGFELEYTSRSYRLVHFSLQTLVGSGTVRYEKEDLNLDKTSDNYFVLQPGINVNLNITNWFRLSGGLFYRYAGGVNLEGTGNTDMSGIVSFVGLRFGKF